MAKRGGYGGGMGIPNMNSIMKQAQKLQQQAIEAQQALEESEFTATSGGGAVEVKVNGKYEVESVTIKEEVVDPDDVEMLQDLIVAAVNSALQQVKTAQEESMSKVSGALGGMGGGLGGLGGLPF